MTRCNALSWERSVETLERLVRGQSGVGPYSGPCGLWAGNFSFDRPHRVAILISKFVVHVKFGRYVRGPLAKDVFK